MALTDFLFKTPKVAKGTNKALKWLDKQMGIKKPGYSDGMSHAKNTVLPLTAAMGIVGIATSQADKAISSAQEAVGNIKHNLGLRSKIDRLIQLQPSLGSVDYDKLVLYYEQMRHFAPDVAKNDLAAAGYIKHSLAMHDQGLPIATYETLAKTQNQMSNAKADEKRGPLGSSLLSGSAFRMSEKGTDTDFQPFFPK